MHRLYQQFGRLRPFRYDGALPWLCFALAFAALLMTGGCGGATDPIDETTESRYVRLTINWAERSRSVSAPSSALSATVRVRNARQGGGDVTFTVDRAEGTAAYSETYTSPDRAFVGNREVEVTFFAARGGIGSVVATARATVSVNAGDGTIGSITNVQRSIQTVTVASGQKVNVGEQKYLSYGASTQSGEIVALAPGSAFFTVVSGGERLTADREVVTGVGGGTASVTATIDGVASAPAEVTVQPSARVAVVGNPADPQVIGLQQALTGKKVNFTLFDQVPEAGELQNFDVLMMAGRAPNFENKITTADAPKVEAYLNTGRGVVLLEDAPAKLAGTANDDGDLTAISSWFGGAVRLRAGAYLTEYARPSAGNFDLPPGIAPSSAVYDPVGGGDANHLWRNEIRNAAVDIVLASNFDGQADVMAFSYVLPSGGRLYWQNHPYGLNPDNRYTGKLITLLVTATNWTAKR